MKKRHTLLKLISALLCGLTVFFFGCGFQLQGDGKINTSGKATLEFEIESEKEYAELKTEIENRISYFAKISGDSDMLKLSSFTQKGENYLFTVKTRRIDKISAYGEFLWGDFNEYGVDDIDDEEEVGDSVLGLISAGNIGGTYKSYDGTTVKVNRKSGLSVDFYDANDEETEIEDVLTSAKTTAKDDTMFLCKLVGVEKLVSLTVRLPGKIRYYAGNNVEKISDDTLVMKPTLVKSEVNTPVDGAIVTEEKQVGAIVGVVIFDKDMSPVTVTLITVGGIAVVGGITAIVVGFYITGKKIIEKGDTL